MLTTVAVCLLEMDSSPSSAAVSLDKLVKSNFSQMVTCFLTAREHWKCSEHSAESQGIGSWALST